MVVAWPPANGHGRPHAGSKKYLQMLVDVMELLNCVEQAHWAFRHIIGSKLPPRCPPSSEIVQHRPNGIEKASSTLSKTWPPDY